MNVTTASVRPFDLASDDVPAARWWERRRIAVPIVLAVHVLLVLAFGGRVHLGGDTGGRAAVLAAVATGEHPHFDVGYRYLADDPELRLHPLYYTQVLDGRAQQVSTLPMLLAARPLHALGGESAALALPILGGIAAALGAAALAARAGARRPMLAFWAIALTSPVTIYSLDLWEHTLGLAAALWAIVVLEPSAGERASWRAGVGRGLAAGALLGLGATMRTEVLVVGAVFGAAAVVRRLGGRRVAAAVGIAIGGAVGAIAVWIANDLLERVVLGASLRSARAGDAAATAGAALGDRIDDAWVTLAGLNYADAGRDRALGSLLLLGLVVAGVGLARRRDLVAVAGSLLAGGALTLRLADGASFLPGLVPVLPLAAVGAVVGLADARRRALAITALLTFPCIWYTAYSGMPGAQWGGRYLFVPGTVLAVLALADAGLRGRVGRILVVLGLAVTAFGLGYLDGRRADVAGAAAAVERLEGDVDLLVARPAFLWRELGSDWRPDAPWLTAVDDDALAAAAGVASSHRLGAVVVLAEVEDPAPTLIGYRRVGSEPFPWIGRPLVAWRFVADDHTA